MAIMPSASNVEAVESRTMLMLEEGKGFEGQTSLIPEEGCEGTSVCQAMPLISLSAPSLPPRPTSQDQAAASAMIEEGTEYDITIDRTAGEKYGCGIDDSDGETLVIKRLSLGLLYRWNLSQTAERWVMLEDRIISANGVQGNADEVYAECMKHHVVHMRLRRASADPDRPPLCLSDGNSVVVHIYDLKPSVRVWNNLTTRFGLYHTGVEVYGREWCFCSSDNLEGVIATGPMQHPSHQYRTSVPLGCTNFTTQDFEELLPLVRMKWPGWSYHPFRNNCHHFTDFLCRLLGFPAGPKCGLFASGDERLFRAIAL